MKIYDNNGEVGEVSSSGAVRRKSSPLEIGKVETYEDIPTWGREYGNVEEYLYPELQDTYKRTRHIGRVKENGRILDANENPFGEVGSDGGIWKIDKNGKPLYQVGKVESGADRIFAGGGALLLRLLGDPPSRYSSEEFPNPDEFRGWSPSRKQDSSVKRWLGFVIALVLLAACIIPLWNSCLSPKLTNSPFFNRHDLPSNLPLPDGSTFVQKNDLDYRSKPDNQLVIGTAWDWTVDNPPTAVQQFYIDHLDKKSWYFIQPGQDDNLDPIIVARDGQGDRLIITATLQDDSISAPSGGSVLIIEIDDKFY